MRRPTPVARGGIEETGAGSYVFETQYKGPSPRSAKHAAARSPSDIPCTVSWFSLLQCNPMGVSPGSGQTIIIKFRQEKKTQRWKGGARYRWAHDGLLWSFSVPNPSCLCPFFGRRPFALLRLTLSASPFFEGGIHPQSNGGKRERGPTRGPTSGTHQ